MRRLSTRRPQEQIRRSDFPWRRDSGIGGRGDAERLDAPAEARGNRNANIPDEYKNQVGNLTAATTEPQLRSFVRRRTVLAIGNSPASAIISGCL